MYLPDAIATLRSGNQTFLVTANEGDVREYDGLNAAGNEDVEVEDITLDADGVSRCRRSQKAGRHRQAEGVQLHGQHRRRRRIRGTVFVWRSVLLDLVVRRRAGVRQRRRSRGDHEGRVSQQLQREQHEQHPGRPQRRQGSGAGRGDRGVAVRTDLHLRDAGAHRRGRRVRGGQPRGADVCAVHQHPQLRRARKHSGSRGPGRRSRARGSCGAEPERQAAADRVQRGQRQPCACSRSPRRSKQEAALGGGSAHDHLRARVRAWRCG